MLRNNAFEQKCLKKYFPKMYGTLVSSEAQVSNCHYLGPDFLFSNAS